MAEAQLEPKEILSAGEMLPHFLILQKEYIHLSAFALKANLAH